jgi:hypothetical protein
MADVDDTFDHGRLSSFDEREAEATDDHALVESTKSEQSKSVKPSSLRRSIEDRLEKKRLESLIEDYAFDDIDEN